MADAQQRTDPVPLVPARRLLPRRQLDVVREVANGGSNEEIAERLGLSVHTVEQHLYRAGIRLGTTGQGRARTLAVAVALRLILPEEIAVPDAVAGGAQ